MDRLRERLAVARAALASLQELVLLGEPSKIERDAAIQRFEYTVEATWKAAQRYLAVVEGLTLGSPKGCLRASREVGLLGDTETSRGLEMIDDRNETVHTYDEAVARRIHSALADHAVLLGSWLAAMEAGARPKE